MLSQLAILALIGIVTQTTGPTEPAHDGRVCAYAFGSGGPIVLGHVASIVTESPATSDTAGKYVTVLKVDEVLRGDVKSPVLRLAYLRFDNDGENMRSKLWSGWVATPPSVGMRACVFLRRNPSTREYETLCVLDLDTAGESALVDVR